MKTASFCVLLLIWASSLAVAQTALPTIEMNIGRKPTSAGDWTNKSLAEIIPPGSVKRIIFRTTTENLDSLTNFRVKYDTLMTYLFASKETARDEEAWHPEETSKVTFHVLTTDARLFYFSVVSEKGSQAPRELRFGDGTSSARIAITGFRFPDAK